MQNIRNKSGTSRAQLSWVNLGLLLVICLGTIATSQPGNFTSAFSTVSLVEQGAVTLTVSLQPSAERRSLLSLEETPLSLALALNRAATDHPVSFRLVMQDAPSGEFVLEGELPRSLEPEGVLGVLCGDMPLAAAECIPCPEDDVCVLRISFQRCGFDIVSEGQASVSLVSPFMSGPITADADFLGDAEADLIASWLEITGVTSSSPLVCSESGMGSVSPDAGMGM
jgi:hypothetical protein